MDVSAHVRKMLDSQKRTLQLQIKYGKPEDLDLNQILNTGMETCKIGKQNSAAKSAIEMAAASNSEQEFDEIFEHNSQIDCSTAAVQQNPMYKEFEQYARDLFAEAGSKTSLSQPLSQTTKIGNDMEITETNQAIDPITKGKLVRPVRNIICKHVYGYQSVMDSLALNRRLRCPMIGCSNKDYIVPGHLVEI